MKIFYGIFLFSIIVGIVNASNLENHNEELTSAIGEITADAIVEDLLSTKQKQSQAKDSYKKDVIANSKVKYNTLLQEAESHLRVRVGNSAFAEMLTR